MTELHTKTLRWARDRKLPESRSIIIQSLKLGSKFGKLCGNLDNNKTILDDIG